MIDYLPLPYPSFTRSVKCFSDFTLLTLAERLPEVYKSLGTSYRYDIPYSHIEFWRAWSDWTPAFAKFTAMCFKELEERGLEYVESVRERVDEYSPNSNDWSKPQWVGWEPLHTEFQGYLLHLGGCEMVAARICALCEVPVHPMSRSLFTWMDRNIGFRSIHFMNRHTLIQAERRLHLEGSPELEEPNHYMQFDWDSREPWNGFTIGVREPGTSYLC